MQNRKIESIQALRFVFCMFIFAFHFRGMMIQTDIFEYGGDAGVSFFFILSGFVLCLGCGRRVEEGNFSEIPFLRSRLLKIYPLHLAALLIALAFSLYMGETFRPGAFVAQLFFAQSWFLSRSMILYCNGVSWFLGPLFLCYALFGWLYRNIVVRRCRNKVFLAAAVAYLAAYSLVSCVPDRVVDGYFNGFPPLRIADFTVGILAYSVFRSGMGRSLQRRLMSAGAAWLTVLDLLCVATVAATYVAYQYLPSWFRFSMLFWIPFSAVICYFAMTDEGDGLVSRLFRFRPVQYLGNISFEIYMLHIIAITVAAYIYGHTVGYGNIFMPALVALSLAVTLLMSAVAKRFVDTVLRMVRTKKQ